MKNIINAWDVLDILRNDGVDIDVYTNTISEILGDADDVPANISYISDIIDHTMRVYRFIVKKWCNDNNLKSYIFIDDESPSVFLSDDDYMIYKMKFM